MTWGRDGTCGTRGRHALYLRDFVLDSSTNPPATLPLIEKASFRFHLPSGFNTWNNEIV